MPPLSLPFWAYWAGTPRHFLVLLKLLRQSGRDITFSLSFGVMSDGSLDNGMKVEVMEAPPSNDCTTLDWAALPESWLLHVCSLGMFAMIMCLYSGQSNSKSWVHSKEKAPILLYPYIQMLANLGLAAYINRQMTLNKVNKDILQCSLKYLGLELEWSQFRFHGMQNVMHGFKHKKLHLWFTTEISSVPGVPNRYYINHL